jgi:predicted kinase
MLIVFAGLPGVGKTTVSKEVARRLKAAHLRIDVVEQAILETLPSADVGPGGYMVCGALARANLDLGTTVVIDAVNALLASRVAWRLIAERAAARLLEVELFCSDREEQRRRLESRQLDLPNHRPPSWSSVVCRPYEDWDRPRLRLDTSRLSQNEAVAEILSAIEPGETHPL